MSLQVRVGLARRYQLTCPRGCQGTLNFVSRSRFRMHLEPQSRLGRILLASLARAANSVSNSKRSGCKQPFGNCKGYTRRAATFRPACSQITSALVPHRPMRHAMQRPGNAKQTKKAKAQGKVAQGSRSRRRRRFSRSTRSRSRCSSSTRRSRGELSRSLCSRSRQRLCRGKLSRSQRLSRSRHRLSRVRFHFHRRPWRIVIWRRRRRLRCGRRCGGRFRRMTLLTCTLGLKGETPGCSLRTLPPSSLRTHPTPIPRKTLAAPQLQATNQAPGRNAQRNQEGGNLIGGQHPVADGGTLAQASLEAGRSTAMLGEHSG